MKLTLQIFLFIISPHICLSQTWVQSSIGAGIDFVHIPAAKVSGLSAKASYNSPIDERFSFSFGLEAIEASFGSSPAYNRDELFIYLHRGHNWGEFGEPWRINHDDGLIKDPSFGYRYNQLQLNVTLNYALLSSRNWSTSFGLGSGLGMITEYNLLDIVPTTISSSTYFPNPPFQGSYALSYSSRYLDLFGLAHLSQTYIVNDRLSVTMSLKSNLSLSSGTNLIHLGLSSQITL